MQIRLFGTFDERRHPRVRVLREGLAAHGTVRVDNVPVPIDTAMRVEALRRWEVWTLGDEEKENRSENGSSTAEANVEAELDALEDEIEPSDNE